MVNGEAQAKVVHLYGHAKPGSRAFMNTAFLNTAQASIEALSLIQGLVKRMETSRAGVFSGSQRCCKITIMAS